MSEYNGYNEVNKSQNNNDSWRNNGGSSNNRNNGGSNDSSHGRDYNNNRNHDSHNNGNKGYSSQNSYSNKTNNGNSYGNKGGGGNSWGNKSGGGNWKKREEEDIDPAKVKIYLPFTVTGNRGTPDSVVSKMVELSKDLTSKGYILRTGGLDGPDDVLDREVPDRELYLPWRGFSDKNSKLYFNTKECMILASKYHPAFDTMKPAIQAFLGMNTRLVMGKDLKSATMFVVVWSEDGAETDRDRSSKTGNVGHVIAIANARSLPVFNLQRDDAVERIYRYLDLSTSKPKQQDDFS